MKGSGTEYPDGSLSGSCYRLFSFESPVFALFLFSYPAFLLVLSDSKIMPDFASSPSLMHLSLTFELFFESTLQMDLLSLSVWGLVVQSVLAVLLLSAFPSVFPQVYQLSLLLPE